MTAVKVGDRVRATCSKSVIGAKPAVPRGRCGECGTRHKLRKVDGSLSAHPHGSALCPGTGTRPFETE